MRNEIMESIPELLVQAEACAAGAMKYEQETGLKQNKSADIQANIAALVADRVAYDQSEVTLTNLRANRRALVVRAKALIAFAREIFKARYGRTWSEGWLPTGFRTSLQVPAVYEDIQALMHAIAIFLANNPDLERKDVQITAAETKALFEALAKAENDINSQRTTVANRLARRNASAAQLRRRIRGLIDELKQLIEPLDNRWLAFGLNKPGLKQTPETPTEVAVTVIASNTLAVQWKPSARADYYHIRKKVNGVDEMFVLDGNSSNADFVIRDVPPNAEVEVSVSAVNPRGESAWSEPVRVLSTTG